MSFLYLLGHSEAIYTRFSFWSSPPTERSFIYVFYNKFLRYTENRIYSHTKSTNLILKVKTPAASLKLDLPVLWWRLHDIRMNFIALRQRRHIYFTARLHKRFHSGIKVRKKHRQIENTSPTNYLTPLMSSFLLYMIFNLCNARSDFVPERTFRSRITTRSDFYRN